MSLFQKTLDSLLSTLDEDLNTVDLVAAAETDAKKKSLEALEAEKKAAELKAAETTKKAELAKQQLQNPGRSL
jgi:hypothetical protein